MRSLLFLTLVCLLSPLCRADTALAQLRQIDASKQPADIAALLADPSLGPSATEPILAEANRLAAVILSRRGDFSSTVARADAFLMLSQKLGETRTLDIEVLRGFALQELDRIGDASDQLQTALARARTEQDSPALVAGLVAFASLQGRLGQFGRAADTLAEAEPLLPLADVEVALRFSMIKALNLLMLNAADAALAEAERGIAQSSKLRIPHVGILLRVVAAATLVRQGRQSESVQRARQAYQMARDLGLPYYLNFAAQVYGNAQQRAGRTQEAEALLLEAESAAVAAQNLLGQATTLRNLATLYEDIGDSAAQIDALKRGIQVQNTRFDFWKAQSIALAEVGVSVDREIAARQIAEAKQAKAAADLARAKTNLQLGFALLVAGILAGAVLWQRARSREKLARSAQVANAERSKWLVRIAHELRNPAQALVSVIDRFGPSSTPQKLDWRSLQTAVRQINTLISDLLDLARAQVSPLKVHPETVEIRHLIGDVQRLFAPNAEAKNLVLRSTVESGTPIWLRIDPIRFTQIISNLITNSISYTQQGGISVHIRARAGMLEAEVSDTGLGMDESEVQRIFEPYFAGRGGQNNYRSVGIGMTIVKYLVDAMDGTIEVQSMTQRGTMVRVLFPLQTAEPIEVGDQSDNAQPSALPSLRVLLLDDDDLVRTLTATQLAATGADVREAANCATARSIYAEFKPDVVIVDSDLGGESGLQFVDELRAHPHRATVLVLSGHDCPDTLPPGVRRWLVKPVRLTQWHEVLAKATQCEPLRG